MIREGYAPTCHGFAIHSMSKEYPGAKVGGGNGRDVSGLRGV